ncbi:hypothetical protein [Cellulomonas sp. Leaf334]|uniref:hypothetical protein n=1 Tax=Cellulomonas sp. Leaf334 TaxID=1736339 RepID=UPI0006F74471|nr:hypothetical protein [Cellulomonas sp. Leaf334]KQR17195.1 hypothetical protein ASF78_07800 [Cellulomonas sp. Leaf334]
MTRDLHELMSDALAQGTRALADTADDGDRVSRMRAAVRRRRTVRATVRGTSVACVAVVVGAVGWLVAPRQDPAPAHTPTPAPSVSRSTSTPTPTPTPTPTSTPTLTSSPDTVLIPGLPAMPEATPEIIAAATPGWVLLRYAGPAPISSDDGLENAAIEQLPKFNALVLVSPDGERFHVADLPSEVHIAIDRWVAGSTEADVSVWDEAVLAWSWGRLDLLSGTVTSGLPGAQTARTVGWSRIGERVVVTGGVHDDAPGIVSVVGRSGESRTYGAEHGVIDAWKVTVDPTGVRVILQDRGRDGMLVILELTTGVMRQVGGFSRPGCAVVSWIDDRRVLIECRTSVDGRPEYWRVDTAEDEHAVMVLGTAGDAVALPLHGHGVATGDGRVAFEARPASDADELCGGSLYVWRSATDTIEGLADVGGADHVLTPMAGLDGDVYASRMPVCADIAMPELIRVAAATGALTTLVPVDWTAPASGAMESFTVGVAG